MILKMFSVFIYKLYYSYKINEVKLNRGHWMLKLSILHNINYSTKLRVSILLSNSYFAVFWILYFICLEINSQNLRSDYSVLKKYDSILEFKNNFKLNQSKQKNSIKWLSILPSINYDIDNQTFNIGISFSNFSRYYQQKQRNKIELQKLEASLQEASARKVSNLEELIFDFESKYNIILLDTSLLATSRQLFQITRGKYINKEIPIEDFLKAKISISTKYKSLIKQCHSLEKVARKIYAICQLSEPNSRIINLKKLLTQEEKNLGSLRASPQ